MASPATSKTDGALIANQYSIDGSRPLAPIGGLAAFGVIDTLSARTDLFALRVQRQFPARPRALQVLTTPIDGLLTPEAYGPVAGAGGADAACYMICMMPPGANLQARTQPWTEAELLECVLRPVAHVLEQMQARRLTHRSIRLDNVYQSRPGQPVVLGTAWAAPPAMAQSALFEPPYVAMCLPAGRGDGNIADDVYALGVLLLCLAMGRVPMADLDDAEVLRRKLELGTYAALAGDERLPPIIGDLVRGMLAEDPDHRPTPTLLLDPASARGRRLAARPPRRAQRPISLAGREIWDVRSLAYAMAGESGAGLQILRSGEAVHWLRRGVGDTALAARLEDLVRHRTVEIYADDSSSDATLVMRSIAVIDPLAPICWRGIALWPDGMGTALAAAVDSDPEVTVRLEEIVGREEAGNWAMMRADRCDFTSLRVDARQQHAWLQQRGQFGGAMRVAYLLNPLMPCSSPLIGGQWVARLQDLPGALEAAAGRADRQKSAPVDANIAVFISARLERRMDNELAALAGAGLPDAVCLAQLRALAQLQTRYRLPALPALAAWIAAQAGPVLLTWRNRERRATVAERLKGLADAGFLGPMLTALDDPTARGADAQEAQLAALQLNRIDIELTQIANGAASRAAVASRLGQEIAAGFGLTALATVLAVAALG